MADQLPDFIPITETPDNIYINPPVYSDGVDTRFNTPHTLVTDLNSQSTKCNYFRLLGRELYQFRTGIRKAKAVLRNLPKGYFIRKTKKGNCYITGHPSGLTLSAVKLLPHFLWLENPSTNQPCICIGCTSPEYSAPNSPTLSLPLPRQSARIITSLSPLINECTINSFKQMSSVIIETPHGFYPKLFKIPLPKIVKPNMALLSVKQEQLQ